MLSVLRDKTLNLEMLRKKQIFNIKCYSFWFDLPTWQNVSSQLSKFHDLFLELLKQCHVILLFLWNLNCLEII